MRLARAVSRLTAAPSRVCVACLRLRPSVFVRPLAVHSRTVVVAWAATTPARSSLCRSCSAPPPSAPVERRLAVEGRSLQDGETPPPLWRKLQAKMVIEFCSKNTPRAGAVQGAPPPSSSPRTLECMN